MPKVDPRKYTAFEEFVYRHCTQQRWLSIDELCRRAKAEGLVRSHQAFCDLFTDWIRDHNRIDLHQIGGLTLKHFNSMTCKYMVQTPEGHQLHYFKLEG
jgi:hypothetical protein